MQEIYIRRRPERRGCRRASLVLLAVLLALGIFAAWLTHRAATATQQAKPAAAPAAPAPTQPAAAQKEQPTVAPQRQPAPESAENMRASEQAALNRIREAAASGKLLEAREAAYRILDRTTTPQIRAELEKFLGDVNTRLVFSPAPMPEKIDYTVQPGDSLARIARKYHTTVELLQKINGITGSLIRVNDRIRILQGRFRVRVNISDNTLTVYLNDRFFKKYPVGTGQYLTTPTGTFKITERIMHPVWWRPDGKKVPYGDPENVLGTHWLSLNVPGYGIHGTWEPESIGKHSSQGCIRMTNPDIEELYTLLPTGTEVEIVKQ